MKQTTLILTLILLSSVAIYGQKLSLTDLSNLCSKKNWEDVNQIMLNKNWTFYESEKGNSYKYNTITWSFNKDYYNDKAQGWFYLYTFEGLPNKVYYSVFNKESYSLIQNSISTAGFKLINSEIENNEVISTYANANYTLTISTEKRKDSDWDDRSTTAYNITLIKKAGIYDEDNGKKTEYYYNNVIKAEYTLLNGKLNGEFKSYYQNGKLKMIDNYTNGIQNGLIKEYDEYGNIEVEYAMVKGSLNGTLKVYYANGKLKKSGYFLNGDEHGNFVEFDSYGNIVAEYVMSKGMKSGMMKVYEDGKISYSTIFLNDIKNGEHIEYYYDEEVSNLYLKLVGEYVNDEKNGPWNLLVNEDGKERILTYKNYTKDILSGLFQDIKGDSLILGSYKNSELHGEYRVYRDFLKLLIGGVTSTDISNLVLVSEGYYYEGLESGYWKYYDITGTLIQEGRYLNGKETGEWKYYYSNWSDGNVGEMPYSKQLYQIQNYSNGKLNGKSIRYSFLEEEEYPCSEVDESKSSLDTCKKFVYQKVLLTTFYKDNKLDGPFELLDSTKSLVNKGYFKDDLKEGSWLQRYNGNDINGEIYFIYQKGSYLNNKREGQWIEYYTEDKIEKTFNYRNDQLHGEYILWNQFNKPSEKKQFDFGKLKEFVRFDSLGIKPVNKYEIYDEKLDSYKCRKTEFLIDGSISQEFWIKKDGEIDHNWFELSFIFATDSNFSDGNKGYKDGELKLLNSINKPIITGEYFKEERTGLWSFYFYEQDVKIESNFSNDKRVDEKYLNLNEDLFSGEFTFVDKEDGIKEIRKIKNGVRNGKTAYINLETNKTIKKENFKDGELK